jgi:hypothetical protein
MPTKKKAVKAAKPKTAKVANPKAKKAVKKATGGANPPSPRRQKL